METNNPITQPKYKILDYVYAINNKTINKAVILGVNICNPIEKGDYIYHLKSVYKDKINNKWYMSGDEYSVLEKYISQSKDVVLKIFKRDQDSYLKALKKDFDDKIKKIEKYLKPLE